MIDWQNEHVIPLRDVPKHLKSRMSGRNMAVATAWRWALRRENPLESFKTPGGRFTSIEAIDRFLEQCSGNKNSPSADGAEVEDKAEAHERAVDAGKALNKLVRPRRKRG